MSEQEEGAKRRKVSEKKAPPSTNPEGRCDVWLPKKNRFCRFEREGTGKLCGHHSTERIPCPVNPKHTVKRDQVEDHVLVCSDRHMLPPEKEPYFAKGVNEGTEPPPVPPGVSLVPEDVEKHVMSVLENYEVPMVIEDCRYEWPPKGEAEKKESEGALRHDEKHEHQIESLLGHLHAVGALPSREVTVKLRGKVDCGEGAGGCMGRQYIEFGAGKGALAVSVARVLYGDGVDTSEGDIILIDRSNFRRKSVHPNLRRVFIDLRDLNLKQLVGGKQVVGFSKHLCGVATDYTLSTFLNSPDVDVACLSIALCCHHRCIYKDYINVPYLASLGIYEEHFKHLVKVSSWAVDGGGKSGKPDPLREALGRKAKRLLDTGRILKLREAGYKCKLLHYIDTRHTPENCLMLVQKETHKGS